MILASTSAARLSELGISSSLVAHVARLREHGDEEAVSRSLQTAALTILVLFGFLVVLLAPLLDWLLMLILPGEEQTEKAAAIIPLAAASLWCGSLGAVFQAGLDGVQRFGAKNLILMGSNLLLLVCGVLAVPRWGLHGLAWSQLVQAACVAVVSLVVLKKSIRDLPYIPRSWSLQELKLLAPSAFHFQVNSIVFLIFEPATKLMMAKFAGLASAGYFEICSQVVTKSRSMLIGALQPLVPAVVRTFVSAPTTLRSSYITSCRYITIAVVVTHAMIMATAPFVSFVFLGRFEREMVLYVSILSAAWGVNTIASTAYFFNIGEDAQRWNTYTQIGLGATNIIFGMALGWSIGGWGVVSGVAISLVCSSAFIIGNYHSRHQILWLHILDAVDRRFVLSLISAALALLLFALTNERFFVAALALIAQMVLCSLLLVRHPIGRDLLSSRARSNS